PDLVVYLRAQVGTLAARIGGRGRAYEQAVPTAYLEALNRRYDEWIGSFTLCPVLTVETDNLNYVSDSASLEKVIRRIQDRLHGKETLTL
ncbi:MAG: deoxynucleoside kinase, partial [Caldilineaceae bacterium]|nr:deoxynucleoside kinase [Caldilineaceae bacterium]